jgi:hypothetical protein
MTDVLDPATSIGAESSARVSATPPPVVDDVARILDPAVNQLFSVTLRLTAMATEQVDGRMANRLLGAVHDIDEAIRRIREDLITELVALHGACDAEHMSW